MAKTDDLPDFAARLSRIMGQLNFSRVALARELALDKTVVGRWLTGVNVPTEHNLSRLTEIVRRQRAGFTLAHWRGDASEFNTAVEGAVSRGPAVDTGTAMPTARMRLVGMRRPPTPEAGLPYIGLWAGFYQSMANRGLALACVLRVAFDGEHLHGEFSEGDFVGGGPAVVLGSRLHLVIQPGPLYDRLGFMIFNSLQAPEAAIIDGLVMVPAADGTGTPSAAPMILFRIDEPEGDSARPTIADIGPRLSRINLQALSAMAESGDPWVYWHDVMPEGIRRALQLRVGAARDDGDIDHIARMPASRSLTASTAEFLSLPVGAPQRVVAQRLRRLLLGD